MLIEINEDTLADLITKNDKVVVQYSASWCGNCRIMKPKLKKMATENENMTFVLVDAENSPESRKLANVSNLPTFATFVNGKLLNETQTNKADVLADLVSDISLNEFIMKLPVIKHLTQLIEDNDQGYLV